MTEQEILDLTIEKKAYQEVIKQFTKGCDARMECSLDEFLRGLENKIKEIDEKLKGNTNSKRETEITAIAHRIWLEAGSPDGEKLVYHYGKLVKLKEVHWEWAVNEWTFGPDYLKMM